MKVTKEQMGELKGLKNQDFGLPSKEQMEASGVPTGDDKESIKQRLMLVFEQVGFMETLTTPAEQQEFAMQLEELVNLMVKKDMKAVAAHPLMKKLEQVMPNQGQAPAPQAAPQQGPTDFAGMVKPPMGGGMSGR